MATAIAQFIIHCLAQAYPQSFELNYLRDGEIYFYNHLNESALVLNQAYQLKSIQTQTKSIQSDCISTLAALANQIQGDLTVISRNDSKHWN